MNIGNISIGIGLYHFRITITITILLIRTNRDGVIDHRGCCCCCGIIRRCFIPWCHLFIVVRPCLGLYRTTVLVP